MAIIVGIFLYFLDSYWNINKQETVYARIEYFLAIQEQVSFFHYDQN